MFRMAKVTAAEPEAKARAPTPPPAPPLAAQHVVVGFMMRV